MIVSASNSRQLRTVVDEVQRVVKDRLGRGARRREGEPDTGWMLLDYGDVVVHAFDEEQRRYYDLERLWSDAPTVPYAASAAVGAGAPGAGGARPEVADTERGAPAPWYAAGE